MAKPTVTRVWIIGLIVMVVGLIIGFVSMGLMFAYGGTFTPAISGNGSDFTPSLDSTFWTTVTFMSLGFLIAAIGGIIQITAWIGAMVNTYQLEDKTWFAVLLVGGLIGLAFALVGFAVMIAYIIAGPDGMPRRLAPPPEMTRPQQPSPYAPVG